MHAKDWDVGYWTNSDIETGFGFIQIEQYFGENNYALVINHYDGKMSWIELSNVKLKAKYGVEKE